MRSKWRALTLASWRVFVNVAISDVNLLDSRIDPEHTRAGIEEKEKEQSYNDIGEKMDNGIDEKSDAGVDAKMADAELLANRKSRISLYFLGLSLRFWRLWRLFLFKAN